MWNSSNAQEHDALLGHPPRNSSSSSSPSSSSSSDRFQTTYDSTNTAMIRNNRADVPVKVSNNSGIQMQGFSDHKDPMHSLTKEEDSTVLLNSVIQKTMPLSGDDMIHKSKRQMLGNTRLSLSVRSTSLPNDVTHLVPSRNVAKSFGMLSSMAVLALFVLLGLGELYGLGRGKAYPKKEPIGPYVLISKQDGVDFFDHYDFYEGMDSAGSNGFQTYVSRDKAEAEGIVKIVSDSSGFANDDNDESTSQSSSISTTATTSSIRTNNLTSSSIWGLGVPSPVNETFVYLGTKATEDGPRDSIRLEGRERFNRGLFILDVRHMPAGCGTWPAFWLTDEHNWPVNGEIDILEGVNFQTQAKTAMHSTKECSMAHETIGLATGWWDTAQGIPDSKSGKPDMTMRYATDCYVYDPHQWLNQGCVAVDLEDGTIGEPLNAKGGGVFALEWDPVNRHIRTWAFTPHDTVPPNLRDSLLTVDNDDTERVAPDTELWGLPYGYFAIGENTDCSASHFKNMRLVFNTAFCGSVAGNRYFMDCPKQRKHFPTCNKWIASDPEEMNEAYWEIRGVYVYEREWMVRPP